MAVWPLAARAQQDDRVPAADSAADQIRTGHQPQDRQSALGL